MGKFSKAAQFIAIIALLVSFEARADSFSASLAAMPQSAEIDKNGNLTGAYVDLVRALDRVTGSTTKIRVVPFQRSITFLINGDADYHIPLIETPGIDPKSLPYAFSTATLFQVAFVLYSNKNKPLEVNNLGKYNIVTDTAHTGFFPFPVKGENCLSCAIRMVNSGRIDGFIFAQNEIDPFIKKFGLNNVHRQLYKNFNVKVLIPKGTQGKAIDNYFSSGMRILKERGEYKKLLAPILSPYQEWQP